MTKKNLIIVLALIALVFATCKDEPEPTHTHEWGEWVQTKAPTETEEGEETRTCATCGETETRPIAKLPPTPTHVHDWGDWTVTTPSTCATEGVETRVCKIDGTVETRPIAIDPNAHDWGNWVTTTPATVTEEGEETRTCATCGETETRPIDKLPPVEPIAKTYEINLKEGQLKFVVAYNALPSEEPAYLAYLETRLALVVNSEGEAGTEATEFLMTKGDHFTINVEYTGSSYVGLFWDNTTQAFKVHNDWIYTASSGDLSAAMIRNAFNSVEIEE